MASILARGTVRRLAVAMLVTPLLLGAAALPATAATPDTCAGPFLECFAAAAKAAPTPAAPEVGETLASTVD